MPQPIQEEEIEFQRTRIGSFKGFVMMFFAMALDEWRELDHKVFRIAAGLAGMAAMAIFWLFFLRSFSGI
jgi:hypothetical protein